MPPEHTFPQLPQLFGSVDVMVQPPAQHALFGAVHWLFVVQATQPPLPLHTCAPHPAHGLPLAPHEVFDCDA